MLNSSAFLQASAMLRASCFTSSVKLSVGSTNGFPVCLMMSESIKAFRRVGTRPRDDGNADLMRFSTGVGTW